MITTILFDMDGTLVDTEKHLKVAWKQAFEAYGYTLSDENAYKLRSLGQPFAVPFFKELLGNDEDYPKIRAKRRELFSAILEEKGLEAKPYVHETMTMLKKKGYHLAVVTASSHETAESHLRKLGILDYFDEVVSSSMVERGKPAPDTYLYALDKLGIKAEQAIAVEDSDNGVISASEAGIKTVFIEDLAPLRKENQQRAYWMKDNLLDFAEALLSENL